jgi:autotransporter strand-loop-strand O-heptosyltransferase
MNQLRGYSMYSNIEKNKNIVLDKSEVLINFIDGPTVEIKSIKENSYLVEFIDSETNNLIYSNEIKNNMWVRNSIKWFKNWNIKITPKNGKPIEYKFELKDKRVFIVFESSSLGDTLAWIPYVEEFRKKHHCKVIVSTFQNHLFKQSYPQIEFVEPGSSVNNLYALYRIGIFYDKSEIDFSKHKTDFLKLPLQSVACDILGLEYREIRPRIKSIEPMTSNKPYICIANHSTAQSKYWNNPTGWQELVDYVKSLGYDVYLLSREEDRYMGNKNPKGVIKVDGKSLEEIGSILLGSRGFIGLGSGLSWLSWALQVPTVLISGFSEPYQEMKDVYRVINEDVCHGCFARHLFDKGDWNWCPDHKGTDRQFECTKSITFEMVKPKIDKMLNL